MIVNAQPITGPDDAAVAAELERRRPELAFLYSTPAYVQQLESFGLESVGAHLRAMAAADDWSSLADHLTDDVVRQLLPVATYADLPGVLAHWYRGRCDGLVLTLPSCIDDTSSLTAVVTACRSI